MRREFDAQDQCLDRLPRTPLPFAVRVLVKTKPAPGGGMAFFRMENDLARTWLGLTGAARIEPIDGAGHYIQHDRPAALVETIRQLIMGVTEGDVHGSRPEKRPKAILPQR